MRTGRTYTRAFDVEARQHELLGIDLGEGPPRRLLAVALAGFAVWTGTLWCAFGWPSPVLFSLYVGPPAFVTAYGVQRSRRLERRYALTCWVITLRYLLIGHRPIVAGGRRRAGRGELLPVRARFGERIEPLLRVRGRAALAGVSVPGSGRSVELRTRARLYGPDYVYRACRRRAGRSA